MDLQSVHDRPIVRRPPLAEGAHEEEDFSSVIVGQVGRRPSAPPYGTDRRRA